MARYEVFIKAIFVTVSLLFVVVGSASAQANSARDVVVHFCTLDAEGEQLTAGGRQRLESMFVGPAAPQPDKLIVIRDFAVSGPFPEKSRVGFRVDYRPVGWIDLPELRFSTFPPTIEMRGDLFVIRKPVQGSANAASHVGEPFELRIEGEMPTPHLTVVAAIPYVKGLRSRAKETSIKKRAERSVRDLNRLR
jgi:hypothetical protein